MKKISIRFHLILLLVAIMLYAPRIPASEEQPPADFTVHQADGIGTFKLSEARGKYVALHFLLKTACPYCIRHTHTYSSRAPEVSDAIQIFLKPDTNKEIRAWSVRLNGKFAEQDSTLQLPVIYRDPDAKLAKQFGIPFGYEFHGQTVHYPALILLGPDGKEVFRYVGKNNGDRYSFDDFSAKITELKSPKK